MSRTQPLQNPDDHTHKDTIQIEMRPESIVIRTEVFEGVLSETRFDGVDCYKAVQSSQIDYVWWNYTCYFTSRELGTNINNLTLSYQG